jgi:hypothetical protein
MSVEVWALIGTTVATLVLFIVPGLVYTWYVLEHMIDDDRSYERVIAAVYGVSPGTRPSAGR